MEASERNLESLVSSQQEQLARYEKRLKDVVAAYKGLLKEKEALEVSLAVTAKPLAQNEEKSNFSNESEAVVNIRNPEENHLQSQILALMNSLATLSAEKSRMEASFQSDKKQMHAQLIQKDQTITELKAKLKQSSEIAKSSIEEVKAKWMIERQEREKESNNQIVMIRELQNLYADERHLKENIEMQLNTFKTQFSSEEVTSSQVYQLQKELKETKAIIKDLEARNKTDCNISDVENPEVLKQIQEEMQQLKDQHAIAIRLERQRVLQAEEKSRNEAILHESRVASLENRLAELSNTVGNYDKLRQIDQNNIKALRNKLQKLESNPAFMAVRNEQMSPSQNYENIKHDVGAIVNEIMFLKSLLYQENSRSLNPIDIGKIFAVCTDHTECEAELKKSAQNYENANAEITKLQGIIEMQKTHLWTLQEKVKILNRNIEEQELELKQQTEKQRQVIREERAKMNNTIAELENENHCRLNELEQQLQKQRQRSLQLLEEKENEIKVLKTSLKLFQSATVAPVAEVNTNFEQHAAYSDDESIDCTAVNSISKTSFMKSKKLSLNENVHMLHYANELARKDIEIATIRKAKNAVESHFRTAIQEKSELLEKIDDLEKEVDRLERCKTREGANLEYLKNVIISFISTQDAEGKRHMMNAISAVLQFTPSEMQKIKANFLKK